MSRKRKYLKWGTFCVSKRYEKMLKRTAGPGVVVTPCTVSKASLWPPRTVSKQRLLSSALYIREHTCAPSITSDSKLSSQSVSESSVIIPDALPLPTCKTLQALSPSRLSSTDLQPNVLLTAPPTPKLGPKNRELYSSRHDYYVQEI